MNREVISDSVMTKRLSKTQRRFEKDARKKARKRELILKFYLGSIAGEYDRLRAQLNAGYVTARAKLRKSRADLYLQAQNEITRLGNDAHQLQQTFEAAQRLAKEANLGEAQIAQKDKITIDPLRKRLTGLKTSILDGEAT